MVKRFDSEDPPFLKWMADNPQGFVVNTERRPTSKYFFLHRSGCFHISGYVSGQQPNAFTSRQYIKVCSNDAQELLEWAAKHRPRAQGFSSLCQTCTPDLQETVIIYPDQVAEDIEYIEGTTRTVTVNYYERNETARKKCLEHWGLACRVCGLRFEDRYGEIGKGFIHVHHLHPLSEISGEYKIDPIKDLVPVCPNCHAMLHKKSPPYTIEQLKEKLRQ